MTDTRLVIKTSQASELLASEMEGRVKETTRKLMKLTSGGKNLSAEEAVGLAVFSLMTGANPFEGEAYWLQGVGPVAGWQLYNRRAYEMLEAEYPNEPSEIWFEERSATQEEAVFNPDKGDIAWFVTMHTALDKTRWQKRLSEFYQAMVENKMDPKMAWEVTKEIVGSEPTWSAVGVVYADEFFSGKVYVNNQPTEKRQPEKWDRNERGKKRARKSCLRQRFPSLNVVDEDSMVIDAEVQEVAKKVAREIIDNPDDPGKPIPEDTKTPEQIMLELGFAK